VPQVALPSRDTRPITGACLAPDCNHESETTSKIRGLSTWNTSSAFGKRPSIMTHQILFSQEKPIEKRVVAHHFNVPLVVQYSGPGHSRILVHCEGGGELDDRNSNPFNELNVSNVSFLVEYLTFSYSKKQQGTGEEKVDMEISQRYSSGGNRMSSKVPPNSNGLQV